MLPARVKVRKKDFLVLAGKQQECRGRARLNYNRPFATNDRMVHGGGQAHYYSRTGTSKQRQVKLHWFRSLCFNVPVRE
mgnify:CR=1 FL=1